MVVALLALLALAEPCRGSGRGLYLPPGYNHELRPLNGVDDEPTLVNISLLITSFGPVNELSMEATTELYFRNHWTDLRLKDLWEHLRVRWGFPEDFDEKIFLSADYHHLIWKPDTFFPDATQVSRPLIDKDDSVFLSLDSEGRLILSARVILKTHCPMNNEYFPFDHQRCPVCISQYKYSDTWQVMEWLWRRTRAARISPSIHTLNYVVDTERSLAKLCSRVGTHGYPTLCINVFFSRRIWQYILNVHVPSFMLVALSFINFWIDKRAIPARAALSITTILAQITLMTGASQRFPASNSLKIVDVYLMVNFVFIFVTMLEYSIVSHPSSMKKQMPKKLQRRKSLFIETADEIVERVRNADTISRYAFPVVFFIWNLSYALWAYIAHGRYPEVGPNFQCT